VELIASGTSLIDNSVDSKIALGDTRGNL
jgi:hypothetical protein